ncbi:MAG: DUF4255 domain-containing protein, partial [Desulfobacterales bacterium]|nr:DUF4255 domain-containing protein [Desulfobacterales bacterium]
LEELTKLWSVFFQTPHALSAAYQASLVLIEAEESIQRSLPVRKRGVYVQPFRQPMIERITSRPPRPPGGAEYAGSPILIGHTLIIEGKRLRGESTKVGFGEVEVTPPDPASIRNTRIELPLSSPPFPAGSLRAGVKDARIIHPVMMGESSEPHGGVESNLGAFVLRPTITVAPFIDGNEIEVKFDPPVWKKQRVSLLLNELDLPPDDRKARAYWFDAPENNGITDGSVTKTKVIRFPISGVKNGDYLVRVRVDRAESPLQIKDGRYKKPKVTIQ